MGEITEIELADRLRRLRLPGRRHATVEQVREATACAGGCTVRYQDGIRMLYADAACPEHGVGGEEA